MKVGFKVTVVLRDVEINDDGRVDLSEGGLSWQADVPRHSIPLMFSFPTQHIPSSPTTKAKAYPHLQKQIPTVAKASPHLQKYIPTVAKAFPHLQKYIPTMAKAYPHLQKRIPAVAKANPYKTYLRQLIFSPQVATLGCS